MELGGKKSKFRYIREKGMVINTLKAENMEIIALYFLIWTIVVIIVLAFIPNVKIKEIANFFKAVLPRLPITDIIKMFRK